MGGLFAQSSPFLPKEAGGLFAQVYLPVCLARYASLCVYSPVCLPVCYTQGVVYLPVCYTPQGVVYPAICLPVYQVVYTRLYASLYTLGR